jgi:hypothetical protein
VFQFVLSTELYQFLKIPVFVAHYIEHKEQNSHLSIWEFISIHYMQGDIKDADYHRDMQLPFKTHDCSAFHIISTSPNLYEVTISPIVQFLNSQYAAPDTCFQKSSHLSKIWQPPRSVIII